MKFPKFQVMKKNLPEKKTNAREDMEEKKTTLQSPTVSKATTSKKKRRKEKRRARHVHVDLPAEHEQD